MTKTQPHQSDETLEFWFKPKGSWRFADKHGLAFISNKRGKMWHRSEDGTMVPHAPTGLTLHPHRLVDAAQNWDGTWGDVVTPVGDGTAVPVTVAGQPAWEFTLPSWAPQGARIAFDAETGIAVRWAEGITYELASFETGVVLDPSFFDEP